MRRTWISRTALLALVVFGGAACASSESGGRAVEPVDVGNLAALAAPAPSAPEEAAASAPEPVGQPDPAPAAQPAPPPARRLVLGTTNGVIALDPETDTVVSSEPAALAARDGSRLVRTTASAADTVVTVLDGATGAVVATQTVDGRYTARVLSADGRRVVLGPEASYAEGRDRTTLLVVEPETGAAPRPYYLIGNVEPEAFSVDGRALFVLQYTPAGAPVQYQVRRLDLTTRAVDDVADRASGWGDAMAGTARNHVMAPDGRRLYTLYTTGDPSAGTGIAFVHVLDLDEQWAFCVDLPAPFGAAGGGPGMTIAAAPDSSRVYAVDLAGGVVAAVDAGTLAVRYSAQFQNLFGVEAAASSAVAADGTLYVAQGNVVVGVAADLAATTTFLNARENVSGVGVTERADRLYLGLSDEVQVMDVRTGLEVGLLDAPGIGRLTSLDPAGGPVDPARSALSCVSLAPAAGRVSRGFTPRC